ncbi:MAG TPA: hypothetical protein EYQ60_20055, partial [Myxococcales bacterium]|nr:hypothetical protein [Myxococcales bacterium]
MGNFRNVATTALIIVALLGSSEAYAGAKITIDDTKWISLGMGARGSYSTVEDMAPNGSDWSHDFNLDNARIYLNGQIHEYVKFEVNTECVFCGNSGLEEFVVLDAVMKIEINPYFNIWGGRVLVPAERQEMNGPFYSSTYDAFKTPFFPADASVEFGDGGAGVYNRDNGVNIWGAAGPEGAFQYVAGIFSGQRAGPNQGDKPLIAARFAYNFLNVEKNPGYYTSGTYYGGLGDIFTVAVAIQHQKDGSGSAANSDHFMGVSADVLFEKVLGRAGVFTFNGEFKHFDVAHYIDPTAGTPEPDDDVEGVTVNLFDGESFSVAGLYLLPNKVGIGQLQPYVRFTGIYPDDSSNRDEFEAGVNYIIDGHNARISLFYQYGDIATKGFVGPNA